MDRRTEQVGLHFSLKNYSQQHCQLESDARGKVAVLNRNLFIKPARARNPITSKTAYFGFNQPYTCKDYLSNKLVKEAEKSIILSIYIRTKRARQRVAILHLFSSQIKPRHLIDRLNSRARIALAGGFAVFIIVKWLS